MNLSMKQKQTQRHRDQTCGCQGREGQGRDGLGIWDQQMQTIIYKTDKQQGLTVQYKDYIQHPVINHNGKGYEKEYIYTPTHIYMCVIHCICIYI